MKIIYSIIFLVSLLYSRDYIWPTDASEILTDVFGGIRGSGRHHTGIDIRTYGINGFDVYAIEGGYISKMLVSTSGYGKALYITMEDGNTSLYAHLDRFNENLEKIKEQLQEKCNCYTIEQEFSDWQLPVSKGEIIGFTGDTGGVSGAHLHFEIRNKKSKPFNPLLTNYSVNDTISPEPKKLIITNINKDSYVNGVPNELEFKLKKISENEYTYNEPIAVNGEVGISLEVIDRMNKSKFKYDIYSIKLIIDNKTIYESRYNNIGFNEGYKVFSERDYSKHVYEGRSVYNLYNKYNLPKSSFVNRRENKPLKFDDKLIHKCEIIVSDFNKNTTKINFNLKSTNEYSTTFDVKVDEGLIISTHDSEVKDIDVYLTNRLKNSIINTDFKKEQISDQMVSISNYNSLFNVLACQPIYKDGTRGAVEYVSLNNSIIPPSGKINIIDKEHGIVVEYIEREFTNKNPVLGLTLDSLMYRYPLFRVGKNSFLSTLFYPKELRNLSNISIFYLDSIDYQLSLDLESALSISSMPIEINYENIKIISKDRLPNSNQLSENMIHDDTFFYLTSSKDYVKPGNNTMMRDPFILGPMYHPLKNEVDIIYSATNYIDQLAIYKYDKRKKIWKFIDNKRDVNNIIATVRDGGVYSIIRDKKAPRITKIIPQVNSTYRYDHFDKIQFEVEDKLSGIKNEKNINVFLNNKKIIVEYNPYRKTVHYNLKDKLKSGTHLIRIEVNDNVGNTNIINGEFFIK